MTLSLNLGGAISSSLGLQHYLYISKIRPLDIHVDRYLVLMVCCHSLSDVKLQLNTPIHNEKYLLWVVALIIKHILRKGSEWLEERNEFPKEPSVLFLEKLDVQDDVLVHFKSYFAFNCFR